MAVPVPEEQLVRRLEPDDSTLTDLPAFLGPPDEVSPDEVSPDAASPDEAPFARLECVDRVAANQVFSLRVGLSGQRQHGVVGDRLTLTSETLRTPYTLSVHVLFDGFVLEPGSSAELELVVIPGQPFPEHEIRLRALTGDLAAGRSILAVYKLAGQILGVASRSVVVEPAGTPVVARSLASGSDVAVDATDDVPDLTLVIARGDAPGETGLMWTWTSPHAAVRPAPERLVSSLGDRPQDFLKRVIRYFDQPRASAVALRYVAGVGKQIADVMPAPVRAALDSLAGVAEQQGRPAHVLLVTQEAYVPWELVWLPEAWDPQRPQFLGAQAVVGRWTLSERKRFPPPSAHVVQAMAVVSGAYEAVPGWQRLEEAEAEAADLVSAWAGVPVNASTEEVLDCLGGLPPADVIHFAVHGRYDPTGQEDGLVLVDGEMLDPLLVRGEQLAAGPLVFLNACQVGAGDAMLGDVAGLADAFLDAGACAVIAPLWAVDDRIARDIAARFYRAVFQDGVQPADFFRDERQYGRPGTDVPETHLAYLFFGHPRLGVTRLAREALDA
ncbi:CHAT domain-containing protein [Modestobacter versicolor]|uniref:CHAT domain-containing protein n=1 Tax=Modestobacter versicolor TaxID=429133 RepID=UPI0034DE8A77